MKAVITCGGTGGHITPALAIADIIKENAPHARLLFVGGVRGMEAEIVARAGYDIRLLEVQGISRKLTASNLKVLFQAGRAVNKAKGILADFAPDIVIGTGGYACYPTLRAAICMGIPAAVHESNAAPGLAVRMLAGRLDRVWLNFANGAKHLPSRAKTKTVGNPLPRGYAVPQPIALPQGTERFLLSFGGSLGASAINRAMLGLMEQERERPDIFHLHATGKRDFAQINDAFSAQGLHDCKNLSLVPFISQMPQYMAAADLVICRAGAMSISELAALGKPAILVPSPNVTGNHQYANANALAEKGAAVLLQEKDIGTLAEQALALLSDEERLLQMSSAIRAFCAADANERIWRDILTLSKKVKGGL